MTAAGKGQVLLGFPAHAGMDPAHRSSLVLCDRLPRTRGDGPVRKKLISQDSMASPHTRGWTLLPGQQRPRAGGFPAHAGMDPFVGSGFRDSMRLPRTRGDGPSCGFTYEVVWTASPHTRGWTRRDRRAPGKVAGFPAHAGMDPSRSRRGCPSTWLPRTRGDGPVRTIGKHSEPRASPHTRGWTVTGKNYSSTGGGFPAHAGMDPRRASRT